MYFVLYEFFWNLIILFKFFILIQYFNRRNERDDRRSRAASVLLMANNNSMYGRGGGGVGRQSAAAIRESIAQSWFQNQSNSTSNGSHRRAMNHYNDSYDEIIEVSTPEKRTVKRVRKVRKGNRPNSQILAVMDGNDDVSVLTETQRLAPSVHDVTKEETVDEVEEEKSAALF